MPIYEVEKPDGSIIEVDAPNVQALETYTKSMMSTPVVGEFKGDQAEIQKEIDGMPDPAMRALAQRAYDEQLAGQDKTLSGPAQSGGEEFPVSGPEPAGAMQYGPGSAVLTPEQTAENQRRFEISPETAKTMAVTGADLLASFLAPQIAIPAKAGRAMMLGKQAVNLGSRMATGAAASGGASAFTDVAMGKPVDKGEAAMYAALSAGGELAGTGAAAALLNVPKLAGTAAQLTIGGRAVNRYYKRKLEDNIIGHFSAIPQRLGVKEVKPVELGSAIGGALDKGARELYKQSNEEIYKAAAENHGEIVFDDLQTFLVDELGLTTPGEVQKFLAGKNFKGMSKVRKYITGIVEGKEAMKPADTIDFLSNIYPQARDKFQASFREMTPDDVAFRDNLKERVLSDIYRNGKMGEAAVISRTVDDSITSTMNEAFRKSPVLKKIPGLNRTEKFDDIIDMLYTSGTANDFNQLARVLSGPEIRVAAEGGSEVIDPAMIQAGLKYQYAKKIYDSAVTSPKKPGEKAQFIPQLFIDEVEKKKDVIGKIFTPEELQKIQADTVLAQKIQADFGSFAEQHAQAINLGLIPAMAGYMAFGGGMTGLVVPNAFGALSALAIFGKNTGDVVKYYADKAPSKLAKVMERTGKAALKGTVLAGPQLMSSH